MDRKIIKVKWIDSESDDDWISKDEIIKWNKEDNLIESVGFFITINGKYLVITQNIDKKNNLFSNSIKIPLDSIIEIEDLYFIPKNNIIEI